MSAPNSEFDTLVASVQSRINTVGVESYPFSHIHVPDCFPENYYELLLSNWPSSDEFANLGDGPVHSLYFQPWPSLADTLTTRGLMKPGFVKNYQFWRHFRTLIEKAVLPAILSNLSKPIRAMMKTNFFQRRPKIKVDDIVFLADELIMRRNLHVLDAHIDDPRSFLSILIYLPDDDSRPHLGTRFYEQIGGGRPKTPAELSKPRLAQYASHCGVTVKEAKLIPFARNTLLAYLNHQKSWHGQHLNELYERKGYQAFIGVRSDFLKFFYDDVSASKLVAFS